MISTTPAQALARQWLRIGLVWLMFGTALTTLGPADPTGLIELAGAAALLYAAVAFGVGVSALVVDHDSPVLPVSEESGRG